MKRTFNLTFLNYKLTIVLIYRKGILSEIKKLEKAPTNIYGYINQIAPQAVTDIEKAIEIFAGKIEYNEVTKEPKLSLFRALTGVWLDFYKTKHGIEPKHGAIEGKAISGIMKYLVQLTATEQEALAVWKNILSRWSELDTFTQSKCELVYINSKMNLIIQQLKPSNDEQETRGI